jgi:hypothetical protein
MRFPLLVRIQHDADLIYSEISNENFLEEAKSWKKSANDNKANANEEKLKAVKSRRLGKKK